MFTLLKSLEGSAGLSQRADQFIAALVIAELFYKFHSFLLALGFPGDLVGAWCDCALRRQVGRAGPACQRSSLIGWVTHGLLTLRPGLVAAIYKFSTDLPAGRQGEPEV